MLKRIFDFSLALFGLFIFSPLWLIFVWAIWLEDLGSVYYVQDRVGRGGRIFKGIKFRSMIPGAENGIGPVPAQEDDPRVTRIGRLMRKAAMDELPQLLNILKGEMSFVGPRALRPLEIEPGAASGPRSIFEVPGFKERSGIQPGLTGVAQVFASRSLAVEEKFKYDLWYVRHRNILLDMWLIFKSITISLSRSWDSQTTPGLRPRQARFIALAIAGLAIAHLTAVSCLAREYTLARGVIDLHSKISDGLYSQEKVIALAGDKGLEILIFNESALRKWEYGVWPLRNIFKKTYQENSVLRIGIRKYLDKFSVLERQFPYLVLIPAVEASPYFYWEAGPFSKRCALVDYYKQVLIIGLNDGYQDMPVVGNKSLWPVSWKAALGLWPMLLIIFGLWLLKKNIRRGAVFVISAGILFLLNNLPFPTASFNVYQGYQGVRPYQELIDYVNRKGGLIFWAHPEVLSQARYFGVEMYTAAHPEELLLTHDYTGFGLTYSDSCEIAAAGGIWDKALLEYIAGRRKKPVWVIGASHYTGESTPLGYVETLFFLKQAKKEDVLAALGQGRMYVRFNLKSTPAVLEEFNAAAAGAGSIRIVIKGSLPAGDGPLKIELIRNGRLFRQFEETEEKWVAVAQDTFYPDEPKVYYRLKIYNRSCLIFSNPVFVEAGK